MRVIGVRASTNHLRYAVLELDANGAVSWVNQGEEHKWTAPRSATTKASKLVEVRREFLRLLAKYKPDKVVIKSPETVRGGPSPDRISMEAIAFLVCGEQNVEVTEKLYSQLKPNKTTAMNSGAVQQYALLHVTQCATHWDSEIADALVAGLRELGK